MSDNRYKLFIILVTLTLSLTDYLASAQTKYRGFIETGYGTLIGDKSGSEWQVGTSHGWLLDAIWVFLGSVFFHIFAI